MTARIAPSILSADFANLESELNRISNADLVHVDVMDGHFVPNLTLGLPVVNRLAEVSPVPIDVHLMVDDADHWAPRYAKSGVKSVTFHLEAAKAPIRLAREIRNNGARASVALRPATPLAAIAPFINEFDMILIMTVEPGFGGQSFLDGCLGKISEARKLIDISGRDIWLEIDGGVAPETIAKAAKAGADTFVAGTAVFGAANPEWEIDTLRELANQAYIS
jgi:ribulose-phosphate 3-epimerase